MTRLYCVDCKHFSQHSLSPSAYCLHEESRNVIGSHTGAILMRAEGGPCGPSGHLFQPRGRRGFLARLFGF